MLVLDAETLAKHYVKGSLSRKQFVSLSASAAQVEQTIQSKKFLGQLIGFFRSPSDLRMYTIKWRIKTVWRFIKHVFLTLLILSVIVFWRVDTEDLYAMWHSKFDVYQFVDLIIKGNPEPLPDDLRLATKYLTNADTWERLHIKQYTKQWMQLDDSKKNVIRETIWFQEFTLLASIKKVEHEKRVINGDMSSVQNLKALDTLANSLS